MRTGTFMLKRGAVALALGSLGLTGTPAFAIDYWLKAMPTTVEMPNPNPPPLPAKQTVTVPMWGYASCGSNFSGCGAPTIPGPALTVPPNDTVLRVNLSNALPMATSLVINGLIKPMVPVWDNGATGNRPNLTARVRSFDIEVATGAATAAPYVWSNVPPGTYLYQSGTQPQVQVQMGLYGAVTRNFADADAAATPPTPAQAYSGVPYDNQATLLYSEIDPALHEAVGGATPTYGTAAGPTSTFDYQPKYFLINGRPYTFGAPVITPAGNPGQTLLRLLNAGLVTHVPMIQGNYWEVVAEDGKAYPYRLQQYTALLPAAKTMDVRLTAEVGTTYAIMDRRLSLSNNGVSGGGMLAFVGWGALASDGGASGGNTPPNAANDSAYASVPGVTLNIAAPGVLANDTDADVPAQTIKAVAAAGGTTPGGGTYLLNANGSFSYTPPSAAFAGADTFTYRATDGQALSASAATVTITVAEPSPPSLGTPLDTFDRADQDNLNAGAPAGVSWSQTASSSSPANVQISGSQAIAAAIDLGGQAIWNAPAFGPKQYAAFTASAHEKSALILKATGGTTASPDTYIRVRYEAANGIVVSTLMGGSTAAVFVKQAAFPGSAGGTLSAAVDEKGLVTVFQNNAYKGGVQLPDVPAWKGSGRIGFQLQTQGATINDFRGGNL